MRILLNEVTSLDLDTGNTSLAQQKCLSRGFEQLMSQCNAVHSLTLGLTQGFETLREGPRRNLYDEKVVLNTI